MTRIRNLLCDRKVGLMAAIFTWIGCLAVLSLDLVRFDQWRTEWSCHEGRRDLESTLEAFALDRGPNEARRLMRRRPIAIQAQLLNEGYLAGLHTCRLGGFPQIWKVEPARVSEFETLCVRHSGSSEIRLRQLRSQKLPICRMFVLGIAGLVVFPLAFWAAACVRSYRWSRRSYVSELPPSWIVVLNLLFAPAGLLAMGRTRQAIWQTIATVGLFACLGWHPLAYMVMNVAWSLAALHFARRI